MTTSSKEEHELVHSTYDKIAEHFSATRHSVWPDVSRFLEEIDIVKVGNEFGVTTGRKRRVNWLNMDKLIKTINFSGTTHFIISKVDIF